MFLKLFGTIAIDPDHESTKYEHLELNLKIADWSPVLDRGLAPGNFQKFGRVMPLDYDKKNCNLKWRPVKVISFTLGRWELWPRGSGGWEAPRNIKWIVPPEISSQMSKFPPTWWISSDAASLFVPMGLKEGRGGNQRRLYTGGAKSNKTTILP